MKLRRIFEIYLFFRVRLAMANGLRKVADTLEKEWK